MSPLAVFSDGCFVTDGCRNGLVVYDERAKWTRQSNSGVAGDSRNQVLRLEEGSEKKHKENIL